VVRHSVRLAGREMPPKPPPPNTLCDDCGGAGTKVNGAGALYQCPTCKGTGRK